MDAAELALGTYVAIAFGKCLRDLSAHERRHAVIDLLHDLELSVGRRCDCVDCASTGQPLVLVGRSARSRP